MQNFFLPEPLLFQQDLLQLQATLRQRERTMSADDNTTKPARLGVATQLPELPPLSAASAETLRVDGTNVVRVPFGVRRPLRTRPARPEHWATLVIPFQAGGSSPTPPPQAA